MSIWVKKWSDEQKQACIDAYCHRRIRPVTKIARMAAAGELTLDGQPLPPFPIPLATVRYYGKTAERRKLGELKATELSPADNAERMRRRLEALADQELSRIERASKRSGYKLDADHSRQVARLVRELKAFPNPDDKRLARKPGERDENGAMVDGQVKTAMAAQILRATDQHAPQEQPATAHLPAPTVTSPPPTETPLLPDLSADEPAMLASAGVVVRAA